jgi:hypothetical protein
VAMNADSMPDGVYQALFVIVTVFFGISPFFAWFITYRIANSSQMRYAAQIHDDIMDLNRELRNTNLQVDDMSGLKGVEAFLYAVLRFTSVDTIPFRIRFTNVSDERTLLLTQ